MKKVLAALFLTMPLLLWPATLTKTPPTEQDDGYDSGLPSFDTGSNAGTMGGQYGVDYNVFFRYTNVTVAKNSTINSAHVTFTAFQSLSGTTCNLNCYLNNVDDSVAPTSQSGMEALVLTSAVTWSAVGAWTIASTYDTPNIAAAVQTVVNRAGWVSGNDMTVVVRNNASTDGAVRQMNQWGVLSVGLAELYIDYTESSGSRKLLTMGVGQR